ncbi:MAG TPA: flagellar type III secretion system pore protein FliP [Limnochordia bacterium]|nr:flagellar type III secretion system pore protein FliP [Limnochordia bacterium]HPT92176.1 flagellar type III secretion system pore protein FliP [Limnochordia bacterium]HXK96828.1 flagellar type III secretion system pore protein FliP [Limnochordia bacterium]
MISELGLNILENPGELTAALQILIALTVLTLAPAILILMTSFTRIVVSLSFIRNAIATNQMPPNQVIIGLSLFLTFFIMAPVFSDAYTNGVAPYLAGEVDFENALNLTLEPIREFMFKHTREKDLAIFLEAGGEPQPEIKEDVSFLALVPAFVISELKTAFQIGFMIFIPFLVIDMIVSSILMAMGMMMLPPVMISLPFKILLFVLVDGWNLVVRSLLVSFY